MRVAFVSDQDHAPTELDVQVEVVRPWYRNIPPLAYAGLVAGAAVLVGLAWLLRRDGPGRRVLARMAPLFSRPNRWRLALAFPQHPIGVPPVFEPGETARVQALARDRRGRDVRARIVILWRGGRTRARAGGDAVDVPVPDQEGVLEITARARGFARLWTPPIKVRVPVHPYRRAVEEGYVALREAARLDPSASPRDLLDALDGRLGAEAARRLREAASLFEVADYSQEGVDRAFYHAFATARLVVEHDLRKPGGGAAGLA